MSNNATHTVFRPAEGALLDLESLQAVSQVPDLLLSSFLDVMMPGSRGIVLSGLEPQGEWASVGTPGTVRPDPRSSEVVVSPGSAVLTGRDGRRYLLRMPEPLRAPWPTQSGPAVQGYLVLAPKVDNGEVPGRAGIAVAHKRVNPVLGFVRPDQIEAEEHLLALAVSVGNGRDWATDLNRIWQPEHAAIAILLKRLQSLEHTVWRAEPGGSVWDRQVLGRNWVRYQTVAASAVQAARILLQSRVSTTMDRVRVLNGLFEQLHNSVERAATELLQFLGPSDGAGPYRKVGDIALREGR